MEIDKQLFRNTFITSIKNGCKKYPDFLTNLELWKSDIIEAINLYLDDDIMPNSNNKDAHSVLSHTLTRVYNETINHPFVIAIVISNHNLFGLLDNYASKDTIPSIVEKYKCDSHNYFHQIDNVYNKPKQHLIDQTIDYYNFIKIEAEQHVKKLQKMIQELETELRV